jgi:endonuclease/exonuclease/phosphatase family metal-dependent hydrolase
LPVYSNHQKADVRPLGRTRLSQINTIRSWLLKLPVLQRWVELIRQLTDPTVTIDVNTIPVHRIPAEGDPLTVVSANLWHDWPRYRDLPRRLESLACLIEDQGAQVVLLQEALRTPNLSASEWLAERLKMVYGYVRANGAEKAIGFEEGPAILTNLPVREHRALKLKSSVDPLVRRMALGAQIELECCNIWVVSAHLGFMRNDNRLQMERLRSWVGELTGDGTAVIGGDFNAGEASEGINLVCEDWQDTFRNLNPGDDGHTHLLRWPWGGILRRKRLDYLFLKPGEHNWSVVDAQHFTTEPTPHSDHKAVMARIYHRPFPAAYPSSTGTIEG